MTKTYNMTIDIAGARAFYANPDTLIQNKAEVLAMTDDQLAEYVFASVTGVSNLAFVQISEV